MKNIYLASSLMLAAAASHSFANENSQSVYTGNINALVGVKQLDEDVWNSDISNQIEFGITSDFGMKDWPFLITGAYLRSSKGDSPGHPDFNSFKVTVETSELRLGVKKIFNVSGFNPYVSVGAALVSATVKGDYKEYSGFKGSTTDSESALGGFIAAGATWTVLENINIGAEVSYSVADVNFNDYLKGNAGGIHAGFLVGYHF